MEVFKELVEMAGLLGTEVYPVHDQWVGRKELCSAYHMVRGSAKDLHFFRTVALLESPKIMGLWGIHSLEVLKQQVGLSFCLWCRKEGQNEGTMVNHLHTGHYCLGLVCKRYLSYFNTMLDKDAASTPKGVHTCLPTKTMEMEKWKGLPEPARLTYWQLHPMLQTGCDVHTCLPAKTMEMEKWKV